MLTGFEVFSGVAQLSVATYAFVRSVQVRVQEQQERANERQRTKARRAGVFVLVGFAATVLVLLGLDALVALDVIESATRLPQRSSLVLRFCADSSVAAALALVAAALLLPQTRTRTQSQTQTNSLTKNTPRLAAFVALVLGTAEVYLLVASVVTLSGPALDSQDTLFAAAVGVRYFALAAANAVLLPDDRDAYDLLEAADEAATATTATTSQTPATQKTVTWTQTWANIRKLFPFLFPKDWFLQMLVAVCLFLLFLGRVVNVLVPLQYKVIIDMLTDKPDDAGPYYAWGAVLLYCSIRYFQSGVGLLSALQSLAWIPVAQFNTREINVTMLRHLHSLSLQFHINRKTGEVLRVMDRGNNSVGSLLSILLFNIVPTFVDIGISIGWFIWFFDVVTGAIVFATMVLYVILTIAITEWRTKYRREMNTLDSASRARAVDSLLNFETVKYYNNENYEVDRFSKSIDAYQVANWKSNASLTLLNTAQNTVITIGLAAGSLVCVRRVVDGELTAGDFVMFITYIIQLYQPLNFFGTYYRAIQQNFIDMESMFDLLNENAAVKDDPDAKEMTCQDGEIRFEEVSFRYDARQPAISNISFTVPPKTTTALVGQSGSGKSTVFRLLFRFYDPQSGRILIDGQDIKHVTQSSLRRAIGVVPQDTVCFNDTIGYNIGYGDVNKSQAEIENAAARAQIHDRITTGFPDGYNTKVGERGLRLSGGEKQRVAIARTLLKDPKIILLDEATSALDNTTEALIQRSLQELTSRRTTLVIAHRLSTIVDADSILVMREGKIVERGNHKELLAAGEARANVAVDGKFKVGDDEEFGWVGTYYLMWMRQLEDESVVETVPPKPVVKLVNGKSAGSGGPPADHGGHGNGGFH